MDKDYVEEVEGYFEKQLERVNSWLSFAEAKNAGLFAANIAILVVVIGLFNTVPVFCVVAGIITMASCAVCLCSFRPIFNSKLIRKGVIKYDSHKDYNLIFYMDIAEIDDLNIYISLVNKRYFSNKGYFSNKAKDLAYEVMENCKITREKYRMFSKAVLIDLVAFVSIIILFIAA